MGEGGWSLNLYVRKANSRLSRPAWIERLVGWALLMLVATMVAAVPLATLTVYTAARSQAQRQRADSYLVTATVIGPQAGNEAGQIPAGSLFGYARVRWSWHDRPHAGSELLYSNPAPGSVTSVWVDSAGRLTGPPWRSLDLVMIPAGLAVGGALLTFVAAWAAAGGFQAWVLRRRARLWGEEWARIGPLWTRNQGQP